MHIELLFQASKLSINLLVMLKMAAPAAMHHILRYIQVAQHGGPEVLQVKSDELPTAMKNLSEGEVLVRCSFAGVNFIDTYFRTGLYKKPLPYVPGEEASGGVVSVGPNVDTSWLGARCAFFQCKGSYSSFIITDVKNIVRVPDSIPDDVAASVMLQGCTAHYLTRDCYKVKAGDTVLVHAAAGGTGLLISQICKIFGATVIGTCSGEDKAKVAQSVGKVDHVVDYSKDDWVAAVRGIAPGGVNAVFDGVGKATFAKGLTVLRRRGHMITFGNASGPVDPIAPLELTKHGSITLQRPTLFDFCEPGETQQRVNDLFGWIEAGKMQVLVGKVFMMSDAAKAHEFLQSRSSMGKVLLNCQEE